MSRCRERAVLGAALCTLLAWLPSGISGATEPAASEPAAPVLSERDIERALRPHAATRGFSARGLARQEDPRAQSVSLNIQFELNSSALKPAASTQLQELERALSAQSLITERFVIAGHTDARGNARYNKQLSLRRAQTVKQFLVGRGIDARRLEATGYGSEHLLEPDRPNDPRNRRVEIRAVGAAPP